MELHDQAEIDKCPCYFVTNPYRTGTLYCSFSALPAPDLCHSLTAPTVRFHKPLLATSGPLVQDGILHTPFPRHHGVYDRTLEPLHAPSQRSLSSQGVLRFGRGCFQHQAHKR